MAVDWNSPECEAWSRGFDYADYCAMVREHFPHLWALPVTSYSRHCKEFDAEINRENSPIDEMWLDDHIDRLVAI